MKYFERYPGRTDVSRYVLYKRAENQKERAELLFERYPDLKQAYDLSMGLSDIFEKTTDKIYALARLAKWDEKVRQAGFKAFNTKSQDPFIITTRRS